MIRSIWELLLQLVPLSKTLPLDQPSITLDWGQKRVDTRFDQATDPQSCLILHLQPADTPQSDMLPEASLQHRFQIKWLRTAGLDPEIQTFLTHYLPYAVLPLHARRAGRAISIGHFAQTLDGKIATHCGESRWIGNPENLTHAHRMRALCDGILIGKGTLEQDRPTLTVRHVPGPNPKRLVLGSSVADYSSLLEACPDRVSAIGCQAPTDFSGPVDFYPLPKTNGHIPCLDILTHLFAEQIYAVYVEGGSQTTSSFLQENAIDIMQLHLAPQIFGSGISALSFPPIDKVGQALTFAPFTFLPVGDTFMFVGKPHWQASPAN